MVIQLLVEFTRLQHDPGTALPTRYGSGRFTSTPAGDENLIAMTLPTTPKGMALVQQGSGVKINGIYYWSDEMRKSGLFGSKVPVRYDPLNLAVAYAYVSEQWVKCISVHVEAFQGRSEKELRQRFNRGPVRESLRKVFSTDRLRAVAK